MPYPLIAFSSGFCFDAYELSIRFPVRVNGRGVACLVSLDTLEECFGCAWEDAEETFALHRHRIETVARALLTRGRMDSEGELRIRRADLAGPDSGAGATHGGRRLAANGEVPFPVARQ